MNLARRRRDLQRRAAAAAAARLFNQVGKLRAAHKWRRRPRREAKSAWGKVLAMVLNRDQRADSAPVVAFLPGRLARAASIFQKFARGEPSRAEPRRAAPSWVRGPPKATRRRPARTHPLSRGSNLSSEPPACRENVGASSRAERGRKRKKLPRIPPQRATSSRVARVTSSRRRPTRRTQTLRGGGAGGRHQNRTKTSPVGRHSTTFPLLFHYAVV